MAIRESNDGESVTETGLGAFTRDAWGRGGINPVRCFRVMEHVGTSAVAQQAPFVQREEHQALGPYLD